MLAGILINNVSIADEKNSEAPLATFDFAIAETISAIGHPPKFLAGLEGYETISRQDGIIPQAINLGHRHFPNLELLSSLPPKNILISPPAHVSLIPKLEEISEVQEFLLYKSSDEHDEKSHWNILEQMTQMLGNLVGDPAASEHYIEQTNSHFDDLKTQLNNIDTPLLVVHLVDERHARVYGNGGIEDMVLNRLGLQNAWQGDVGQWGMTTISATSLFNTNAKLILLEIPYGPVGGLERLIADGQWRHLPSVREGNYTIVPVNYWSWGGFPSALRFAESLKEALENT